MIAATATAAGHNKRRGSVRGRQTDELTSAADDATFAAVVATRNDLIKHGNEVVKMWCNVAYA